MYCFTYSELVVDRRKGTESGFRDFPYLYELMRRHFPRRVEAELSLQLPSAVFLPLAFNGRLEHS